MKAVILLLLLQHPIVSARAGLVTLIDGLVDHDVRVQDHLGEGNPVTTGDDTRLEILLNPYSYVRIGSRSEIVLECEDLDNIIVRVSKGVALIDAGRVEKDMPITIRTGSLEAQIVKPGIYLVRESTVWVVRGELWASGPAGGKVKGGWILSQPRRVFEKSKVPKTRTHPLVEWNAERRKEVQGSSPGNFGIEGLSL